MRKFPGIYAKQFKKQEEKLCKTRKKENLKNKRKSHYFCSLWSKRNKGSFVSSLSPVKYFSGF